jgi:hypothetical protein
MASIRRPTPVKLFLGVISGFEPVMSEAVALFSQRFGVVDVTAGPMEFNSTAYYKKVMGSGLKRWFAGFGELIDPARLAEAKLLTQEIEAELTRRHGEHLGVLRPINLDPGYMVSSKIILASVKDFSHRVYLGQGIYGEVTLQYHAGAFSTLPWTYPDFGSAPYQEFLLRLRKVYRGQL